MIIVGVLSAELNGGNFWQGAAIGLVVSALNHVAHRMTVISRADAAIADEGINPTDEVVPRGSTSGMTKSEVKHCSQGKQCHLFQKWTNYPIYMI